MWLQQEIIGSGNGNDYGSETKSQFSDKGFYVLLILFSRRKTIRKGSDVMEVKAMTIKDQIQCALTHKQTPENAITGSERMNTS